MLHRRRTFLGAAGALALAPWLPARAQQPVPIADMHSHYGMIQRKLADSGLAEDMRARRVAIVAWKLVADGPWIRSSDRGIEQAREPAPGQLAAYFERWVDRMNAYIAEHKLRAVLAPADVDACISGEAGIVLASEGADFLEGKVENLGAAYRKGLRHLQLVHYIRTPVGDFQTIAPVHQGLSPMGKQLVEACNAQGILVDLAHSTGASVDQALEISKAPMVWSHGWVQGDGGSWQDPYGFQKRRLSVAHAKKIAARGGVIGLWAFGMSRPSTEWPVGANDPRGYARQIAALLQLIGAEHVAFGTDIEGVGLSASLGNYAQLREVVQHLESMKLDASTIERVAYGNYARVLKAALKA
jgi:membrane dipeptidase